MIKFIDMKDREEFISSQDATEPKTVFVLKPLSSMDHGKTIRRYEEQMQLDAMFETVKACLVEIRNGEAVIKDITDDVIKSIPLNVIIELMDRIMAKNTLSGQDTKN